MFETVDEKYHQLAVLLRPYPWVAGLSAEDLHKEGEHSVGNWRVFVLKTKPGGEPDAMPVHAWYGADIVLEELEGDKFKEQRDDHWESMGWVGTEGQIHAAGEGPHALGDDDDDDDEGSEIEDAGILIADHLEHCTKALLLGMAEWCTALRPEGAKTRDGVKVRWQKKFGRIIKALENSLQDAGDDSDDEHELEPVGQDESDG